MAIIERIVTVYNDKGSKQALKDLKKLEDNFVNASKNIAKAFGVAALAAGAFAVKLGKDAVAGAIEDQKAQAALAVALQNTTGATQAQIASVQSYLDTLELQVGVNNNELIPSLQKLAQATGDVEQAQSLQALALDISAGSGKSLAATTDAIVRAIGGNIGALKKLGVPLDATIVKNKDLNAALRSLSATFAGQAGKRAQTFEYQIERLRLQFDQTLDSLGYALIPVLQQLAEVFRTQILPAFEQFISQNKDQIAETLGNVVKFAFEAAKGLAAMFKTIADNATTFKVFAGILTGIFVGTKVYAGVMAVAGAIGFLTKQFKRQAVAGTAAGTATAFATGGASALAAAAGLATFAAAAGVTWYAINRLTDGVSNNSKAFTTNSQVVNNHLKDLGRLAEATNAANVASKGVLTTITTTIAKTKAQILLEKTLAALKKKGIVPTSSLDKEAQEAIQLEAARLNQIKQGNLEQARRVEQLMKNLEAQMKLNEAAQRYADLLTVLSDQVISDEEVSVLAQKWNITKGEVLEYIARIYAANSTELNDGPIVNLLMKWGLTKEEAEKYVDFTRALKDEKIDDKEIEELMGKWGMTRAEVLNYAKTVQDGSALQLALSKSWASPGDAAAESWKNALAALNAYLAALNGKTVTTPTTPTTPKVPTTPVTPVLPKVSKDIQEQIDSLTELRKEVTPGSALGFKLKEQIDALVEGSSLFSAIPQVDEREKLRAMGMFNTSSIGATSSFDVGSFRMAENASMIVNLNVQGNVQTENDLVDTFRKKILYDQQSGKPISFVGGL